MLNNVLGLIVCLSLSTLFVGQSLACNNLDSQLEKNVIQEYLKIITNKSANEIEQAEAIELLMCDKRVSVRELTIQKALESDSKFIKGKILREILYGKQNIVIEFISEENITNEVKKWLTKNPSFALSASFYDREKACIGLAYPDCRGKYVLDISGTVVDINYNDNIGKFILDESKNLVGDFYPKGLGASIKSIIRIH